MKLYGFDARTLATVEETECSLSVALRRFEACYDRGLARYQSVEAAISATSFGLYRSEEDFIEISCNGKDDVLIHSDRLFYSSGFARWFTTKQHLGIKSDRFHCGQVIKDYFELERRAFESAYSQFTCR
jgi:hypothetical protein